MGELERRAWMDGRVELRAADGQRHIYQRAVPYGELSVDLGGWREVIVAGAFAVDGQDIRTLWQHDASQVLGRTVAGTLELREADDGVYAETVPPDTSWARDALVSIERGDVTGSSFGFYVDEDEWIISERDVVRRVKRGRLIEISPVTFPAYPTTSTSVRDKAAAMRAQSAVPDIAELQTQARARRAAARKRQLEIMEANNGNERA